MLHWMCVSFPTALLSGRNISRMSDQYQFNDEETLLLEAVFAYNTHPTREKKRQLAKTLVVQEKKIVNWFLHKRYRMSCNRKMPLTRCSKCKCIAIFLLSSTAIRWILHVRWIYIKSTVSLKLVVFYLHVLHTCNQESSKVKRNSSVWNGNNRVIVMALKESDQWMPFVKKYTLLMIYLP